MEISIYSQRTESVLIKKTRVPLEWNPIYKELRKILYKQQNDEKLKK